MSKTNEPTLSEQLAQLDEIVAWFEQDDFDMEEALGKFEELENKIIVLKEKFDSE